MADDEPRMWWHSIDYQRDALNRQAWIDRGFWLHSTPRLMLPCRLLGHRPIVDGTQGTRTSDGARWVACGRCRVRAWPQGSLRPDRWTIGQPYHGLMNGTLSEDCRERLPGPMPSDPRGVVGGQLVVAGGHSGFGVEVKIGHPGSEHTLAAHLHLGKLGGLYLHTEKHGEGLARWLNPERPDSERRYESRVIGLDIHDGRAWWRIWAPRDSWRNTDPRWQQGNAGLDPRVWVAGERRYGWEDVGEPVETTIRLADGDDHQVRLQPQRWWTYRTKRPDRRREQRWSADVHVTGKGISTRPDSWKDGLIGWHVDLTERGVENGRWVQEAADKAAAFVSADRSRYGYRPQPDGVAADG